MSLLNSEIHALLTQNIINNLFSKQIYSVSDFLNANIQNITQITGLTFKEILSIKHYIIQNYSAKLRNSLDYYKSILKNSALLPTGIKSVDVLLEGGFQTGTVYEICGKAASGKTQFILSTIKNIVLNFGEVYYLNTKCNFLGTKLKKMLSSVSNEKCINALKNLLVFNITTKYELVKVLFQIKNDLENGVRFRLIVLDSLPPLMLDCRNPVENNLFLNHVSNIIHYLCTEYHLVFLVVNLTTSFMSGDCFTSTTSKISTEKTLCGKYWKTVSNTRIKIEKNKRESIFNLIILESDTLLSVGHSVHLTLANEGFSEFIDN